MTARWLSTQDTTGMSDPWTPSFATAELTTGGAGLLFPSFWLSLALHLCRSDCQSDFGCLLWYTKSILSTWNLANSVDQPVWCLRNDCFSWFSCVLGLQIHVQKKDKKAEEWRWKNKFTMIRRSKLKNKEYEEKKATKGEKKKKKKNKITRKEERRSFALCQGKTSWSKWETKLQRLDEAIALMTSYEDFMMLAAKQLVEVSSGLSKMEPLKKVSNRLEMDAVRSSSLTMKRRQRSLPPNGPLFDPRYL